MSSPFNPALWTGPKPEAPELRRLARLAWNALDNGDSKAAIVHIDALLLLETCEYARKDAVKAKALAFSKPKKASDLLLSWYV